MLDARVEQVLHVGEARMRNDGAIPQSPRPPHHAALKPPDDATSSDVTGNLVEELIAFQPPRAEMSILQSGTDAGFGESRPEIRVLHDVGAGLLEDGVVRVKGSAN